MSGRSRITVLTPNPAIDVTYRCRQLRWGEVNRVAQVTRRAGGKGVNVASVLTQLGIPVRVTGFLGGASGEELHRLLDPSGIEQDWVGIEGHTRSTTVIHDDAHATLFNEPGPTVGVEDWEILAATATSGLGPGDVLVVSGSCPPGTREDDLVGLLSAARKAGARTLLDTSGKLLNAAAPLCDLVKPNREELEQATGMSDPVAGARFLLDQGAGAVVVSAGSRGMDLFLPGDNGFRSWHAAPPAVVEGNPTGAGDAAAAALAHGLLNAADNDLLHLVDTLGSAVSLSAAAVLAPVAGVVDTHAYENFRNAAAVKETNVTR